MKCNKCLNDKSKIKSRSELYESPSLKQEKILTKEFKICFYLLEHKRVVEKNLDLFYFEESIRFD